MREKNEIHCWQNETMQNFYYYYLFLALSLSLSLFLSLLSSFPSVTLWRVLLYLLTVPFHLISVHIDIVHARRRTFRALDTPDECDLSFNVTHDFFLMFPNYRDAERVESTATCRQGIRRRFVQMFEIQTVKSPKITFTIAHRSNNKTHSSFSCDFFLFRFSLLLFFFFFFSDKTRMIFELEARTRKGDETLSLWTNRTVCSRLQGVVQLIL